MDSETIEDSLLSRPHPTPGERVQRAKIHLNYFRKRIYPVLVDWKKHGLTRQDNYYGFLRLDLLREELEFLDRELNEQSSDE